MTETNTSVIENLKLMMEASAWDGKLELSDALANIEQLRAAIAQQAEQGWQPIETAPKDGTDILVMYMHIDKQIVHNAFWLGDEYYDTDPSGWWTYKPSEVSRLLLDDWMTPTHWMPLPSAPKETK